MFPGEIDIFIPSGVSIPIVSVCANKQYILSLQHVATITGIWHAI